jgi:hypothetical protein
MKGTNVDKILRAAPELKLDSRQAGPSPGSNLAIAGKELKERWNTKLLGLRVAADAASAACAAALVAPVIMVIDR